MVLKKYRCPKCKREFEAEEPPPTIPVSVVWCAICDYVAEEVEKE